MPALVVRNFDPQDVPQIYHRFLEANGNRVANPDFIHAGTNLTGVGWYLPSGGTDTSFAARRQYTMVSPIHFVGANHFRPALSGKLRFLTSTNTIETRDIEGFVRIVDNNGTGTDLLLGTLSSPILPSSGITFQPYLSLPSEASYVGREMAYLGHTPGTPLFLRGGTNGVISVQNFQPIPLNPSFLDNTRVLITTYEESGGDPGDSYVQVGDSGAPTLFSSNGQGAIVSIHSAVIVPDEPAGARTIFNLDTFIPHYIEELNAQMALEGYHMTRLVPTEPGLIQPSAPLTLSTTTPPVIRAGYPATFTHTVANTSSTEDANNVVLTQTLPPGTTRMTSGPGWVALPDELARRGGIASSSQIALSSTITFQNSGSLSIPISFWADESSVQTSSLSVTVIGSFRAFTADLSDQSTLGDDDRDGIPNIIEYALGGDASAPDLALSPVTSENAFVFPRHLDFAARGLTYVVETSPSLADGSWSPLASSALQTSSGSAPGMETVTATLPDQPGGLYARLKITLDEGN